MQTRARPPAKSLKSDAGPKTSPQKAKLHPAALNNQVLENMLYSTTHKSLLKFLSSELDRVDKKMALELIESFGPEVGPMIMHGFCLAVMILPPGTFA